MTEKVDTDLLEKEYFHLQSVVEDFDAKTLTIKAWSVSLAVAVASSGAFTKNYVLLIYAAFAALMFWFIETYWKTFQYANYQRIYQIESFLSGKVDDIQTPQIAASWGVSYRQGGRKRFYKIFFWPHVALPHGAMFIGFLLAYSLIITSSSG